MPLKCSVNWDEEMNSIQSCSAGFPPPPKRGLLPRGLLSRLVAAAVLLPALMGAGLCTAQGLSSAGLSAPSLGQSASSVGSGASGLTDEPIYVGEVVHVSVFNAPDFSTSARVSDGGEIGLPFVGTVHVVGLSSSTAGELIAKVLRDSNMVREPHVLVTVDSTSTGITVLGEVRNPGVFNAPGKRLLSDLLAMAGGMTSHVGRVLEISSEAEPEKKTLIPWDPTMHNTAIYDRPVLPGERILVKPCGFVYVGGNVGRPGAYENCTSTEVTLSQIVNMAYGIQLNTVYRHVVLIHRNPDGTKVVREIDLGKVLRGKLADPVVKDDDIVFVPPSRLKMLLTNVPGYAESTFQTLLYVYR
jgi:polysaccharide biosynthesis/export protein